MNSFKTFEKLIDYFFKFKEELRTLFPDWDALEERKEVIRFACGIPTASAHMMQFVFDLYVHSSLEYEYDSIQFSSPYDSEESLKSLPRPWLKKCVTKVDLL